MTEVETDAMARHNTASPSNGIRERFQGCLLGGAVGDALGAPVEFLTLDAILPPETVLRLHVTARSPTHAADDDRFA